MKSRRTASRNFSGSIVIMTCVMTGLLVFGLLAVLSLTTLFATHYRLQKAAETLALASAASQNADNKIGIVNKMMARSRNMIWLASENKRKAQEHYTQLESLANQIFVESKVSRDRMYIAKSMTASNTGSGSTTLSLFRQLKDSFMIELPWLKVSALDAPAIFYGSVKDTGSNVRLEMAEESIEQNDLDQNLVFQNSKLFKGNVDARLQSENGNLSFHIAALPAEFNGVTSQAHLISASQFDQYAAPHFLRSACMVTLSVDLYCPLIGQKQKLVAKGYAVAASGLPDEE